MLDLDIVYGKPFKVNGIVVRNPTVREILEYGEDNYMSTINIFTLKPSDLMVELYDDGVDYQTITPFDVFTYMCAEIYISERDGKDSAVQKRLGWLTDVFDFSFYVDEDTGKMFLHSKSKNLTIDEPTYWLIRKYLLAINYRDDKEKYNPGNEETKRAIIEQERRRIKRESRRKNRSSFLANQISCLVWGNTSGYKYSDVLDMPIIQLYDGIARINKIKHYDNVMFGWYSGNIEKKEMDKISEKVHWMN